MRGSLPLASKDARIVELTRALRATGAGWEVLLPTGTSLSLAEEPRAVEYRLVLRNTRLLRGRITELALGRAYVDGDVDLEVVRPGPEASTRLFDVRDGLATGMPVTQLLRLAGEIAFVPPTRANARAIGHHYSVEADFFRSFLDRRWQFYSQCRFDGRDITLEEAADRKLEHMATSLGLKRGQRLLDIGGGWGGLAEYAARHGLEVTSLTLAEDSKGSIEERLATNGLRGEVLLEDLLEHRRRSYYDHVVIFGVIEHIPTYRRFCRRVWESLRPGGRLYLDASATRQKYAGSAFTRAYTWQGPHSCLALQDMVQELLFHGFAVLEVHNGSDDYRRTMQAWAINLEARADAISRRWGERAYRAQRVFLWGGAHGFQTGRLQAYTIVAQREDRPGPRPGVLRRVAHFAASLR